MNKKECFRCTECYGTGFIPDKDNTGAVSCPQCDGEGTTDWIGQIIPKGSSKLQYLTPLDTTYSLWLTHFNNAKKRYEKLLSTRGGKRKNEV